MALTRTTEAVMSPSSVSVSPKLMPEMLAVPSVTGSVAVAGARVTIPVPALIAFPMFMLSAVRLTALLVVVMPATPSTAPTARVTLGWSTTVIPLVALAAIFAMLLVELLSVTGPMLDTRRFAAASEPMALWLMLPLLISDNESDGLEIGN